MDAAGTIPRLRPLLLDSGDAIRLEPPGATESAVLVPLTDCDGELSIVFTRRRDDLRRHAGEFSFPGGRRDEGESDLLATALRETDEEIGIPATSIDVIGALPPTSTIATGFSIHPFVGVVPEGSWSIAAPAEVAEVVAIPASELIATAGRERLERGPIAFRTAVHPVGERVIWGATARILADLFERLRLAA